MRNTLTLDEIRDYLKREKATLAFELSDNAEVAQHRIYDWYYQVGRESMLQDLLKWEQGLNEHEFRVRRRNDTL